MSKFQVEALIFRKINDFYEFLLLKRIAKKGGFWQPPCGRVEDESIIDAAYREVFEETGIKKDQIKKVIEKVHHFVMDKHYFTQEPIELIEEFVFAFEVPGDIKVDIENNIYVEHEEFKWVSFDEAIKLLKWDNNKDAVKKLNDILLSK